ncbi:hypothetical protein [Fusobacterium sp. PH5-44]|uniref:hypothetical protein n=1 Tax=unclassified Fusobacterium TaxID=2648384 RepID=UPI003D1F36C3
MEPNFDILEKYEEKEDNVMCIKAFDENNNEVTNLKQVILYLSKNPLLGFGTELIRFSESYREDRHFHLETAEKKRRYSPNFGSVFNTQ